MIGFILGGLWGANWSGMIDHHFSASAIPMAVGGALLVAGIGAWVQHYLYAGPLGLLIFVVATKVKFEFPAQNRASRSFAAVLFALGAVTFLTGVIGRYSSPF